MTNVKVAFYVEIPLSFFTKAKLDVIKSHLTKSIRDYMTDEIVVVEYFYIDEIGKTISLPRFYPLEFDDYEFISIEGKRLRDGYKMSDGFAFKPGQEQDVNKAISEDILTLMKPPGSGKTIIGASAIFKRGVRSLILVDQDKLKKQWVSAIQLVFGDSVKINNNIKLDGTTKDMDCDIYITTIQGVIAKIRKFGLTEVRKYYEQYNIGHVLFDECHVLIGPDKFTQFCLICNSRYILALSATPKNDVYYQYWLGTVILGDKDYEVSPKIVELEFNASLEYKTKYISWGGKFHKDRHSNILFKNESYLSFITSLAFKSYILNRQMLLICDYNKFGVNEVYERVIKVIPEQYVMKFIGGCNKDADSSHRIIISNYKMLQKGVDIAGLDTLLMMTELGDITGLEQTIGRLLRLNKGIQKKELIVFDVQETSFSDSAWRKPKRFSFYNEKGFTII